MASQSHRSWALAFASIALTLLAVEAAARLWVWVRWPHQKVYELTHLTETRGRFCTHPSLPYALTPGFDHLGTHHSRLGFRGAEIPRERTPGVPRVALIGASSVYAIYAPDGRTAADALRDALAARGIRAEILNAGVPGWTSRETLVSLRERVLPMSPDIVVAMDGRNDAFPELFRRFSPDYSHYRIPGYEVRLTNAAWKRVFAWSHALMVIVSRGEVLGFSARAEHPDYGSIRVENTPTPAEAVRFAEDTQRFETFRTDTREIVRVCREHGIVPVLAVVPFRAEGWASGVLHGKAYVPAIRVAMAANTGFVRSLAAAEALPLVETADLLRPELMRDDCHFNWHGEAALGRRYADVLEPLIRALPSSR